MEDDTAFLKAMSAGYSAVAARVPSAGLPAPKTAAVLSELRALQDGVAEELELHEGYAGKWGVDLHAPHPPSPGAAAYLSFLKERFEDPEETAAGVLVSLVPCLRMYAYLGATLARAFPDPDPETQAAHPYAGWLETYAGQAYAKLPATAEVLLDALAAGDPDKGEQNITKRGVARIH